MITKSLKRIVFFGIFLLGFMFFVGCDSSKDAGESCSDTPEGAALCASAICLSVNCGDEIQYVCAGAQCEEGDCGDGICVTTKAGNNYCLPANVCTHSE